MQRKTIIENPPAGITVLSVADLKKTWFQEIIAKYLDFLESWQKKITGDKELNEYNTALEKLRRELKSCLLFESLVTNINCIHDYIYKTYPNTQLRSELKDFEDKKIVFTDIDKQRQISGLRAYLDYLLEILAQYKDDLSSLFKKINSVRTDTPVPNTETKGPATVVIKISASTELKHQCSEFIGQNSTVFTDLTMQLHSKDKAKLQALINANINMFYEKKNEYKDLCIKTGTEFEQKYYQSIALQLLIGYKNLLDLFMDDKVAKFLLKPEDFAVVLVNCYELLNWFFVDFKKINKIKIDFPMELQSPYVSIFEFDQVQGLIKISELKKKPFLKKVWLRYEDLKWRDYFERFTKRI